MTTTAPEDDPALARAMSLYPLTLTQAIVWREITRGGTAPAIAAHLYLSEHTVRTHTARVLRRLPLRCNDRTAAAVHALRRGVFTLTPYPPDRMKRPLSERELQVATLLAEGLANAEIGELLEISPLTVKAHLARMSEVVGTGSRTNIATRLYRAGVIK